AASAVLFALLYHYSPHLALHSFPTRRSSDLRQEDMVAGAEMHRIHLTLDGEGRGATDQQHPLVFLLIVPLALRRGVTPGHNALEDRKSTRLNSSHVKISYAVFCLKKKIPTAG